MKKILENILEKLGINESPLRRRVRRILGKTNPLTDPICDHGYTITGLLNMLNIIEKSPDDYDDYDFPIQEECVCRKMYHSLKGKKSEERQPSELRHKIRKILPEMDPFDSKLVDCVHGYTINKLIDMVEKSPDSEFPVQEKCACRELYHELKACKVSEEK